MQYDFNLAPNESTVLEVTGKFFKFKSGTGVITVRTSSGGSIELLPGQGVWNVEYTRLTIRNTSGAANVGVLLAGAFDFHDDRIVGTVEVISGEKARVMAGNSFGGSTGCSPDVTFPSMVQIYNPVASGKNVFVNRIITGGSAAGEWLISSTATPLANLVAGGFSNKKMSGASSSAERRREARAALGNTVFDFFAALNAPVDIVMAEPLMVPPGNGLVVYPAAVNSLAVANFQFYEDLI